MSLALHVPGSADGWLRHIDARWKIAGVFALVVGIACLSDWPATFVAAGLAIILARSAGIGLGRLTLRLAPIVGMLLLFFGWAVFRPRPDDHPWTLFGLPISPAAGRILLILVGKAIALVSLIVTLLETTPMPELGQGATALGAPRLFVHLVLLTQRYVFVLAEEFGHLRRALRVRGFRSRADRRTFATIGNIAGALVVRGQERADRVYHAMAARGFDGVFRSLSASRTSARDVVFFMMALIAVGILVAWDWGYLTSRATGRF